MTLDFFGTPKLTIKKKNVFAVMHNKNIVVNYKFKERNILLKPLGLSLTLFAFYVVVIVYSRISLSFAEAPRPKSKVKLL